MINVSEKYRFKALACEGIARDAIDPAVRDAWMDIAIEWHALAHRAAQETSVGVVTNRCSKTSTKPDGATVVPA
jgi:predicted CoA-binding protein